MRYQPAAGKTYSALAVADELGKLTRAHGLGEGRVAAIDTERGSMSRSKVGYEPGSDSTFDTVDADRTFTARSTTSTRSRLPSPKAST
jgi:hypothetical protein